MTTVWKVLADRLPTHVNLEKREIDLESSMCFLCREEKEFGSHIFFKCKVAWKVWSLCSKWVGEAFVYHWDALSHFNQFYLGWASQKINRYWGCMWIAVIGEIWKQRNLIIFKNGRVDCLKIFTLA